MKKAIYVIIIAVIIILGVVTVKYVTKDENETLTSVKQTENIHENEIITIVENNVDNELLTEDLEDEEEEENKIAEETAKDSMSDEEKAKEVVKKDWGEDSSVYFENEKNANLGRGQFEITVRDKNTTNILYRYTVNINTGEFSYEVEAH